MKKFTHTLLVFVVPALLLPFLGCHTPRSAGDGHHHIKYTVSEQTVAIVSALTPYDSDLKARENFLRWFRRGFETVLTGSPPLMIEWQDSPEGRAGRRGYDLGMDEAEKYLRKKKPTRSLQTTQIPVE